MNIENLKEKARAHEWDEEWSQAIGLYMQALETAPEDRPPDTALYNRVGDLQIRMGDLNGAIDNYLTAVDLYLDAELPNAAIAICRKIIRNAPNRAEVFLKMGQIRADQGFLTDARQNFLTYAERKQRAGDMEEAFRALVEFVELAPDDAEIRRALADRLMAHERSEEALDQYRALYFQLLREEDEGADEVEELIRSIDPDADLDPPADPPGWSEMREMSTDEPEGAGELPPVVVAGDLPAPDVDRLGGFEATALVETPPVEAGDAVDGAETGDDVESSGEGVAAAGLLEDDPDAGTAAAVADDHEEEEDDDAWMDGVRLVSTPPAEVAGASEPEEDEPTGVIEPSEEPDADTVAAEAPLAAADPPATDDLLQPHEVFAADGDWDAASRALSALIEDDPNDVALRQRAVEYAFRSHEDGALATAYLGLAEALGAGGDEEKARAVLRQVLAVDPDNVAAREALEGAGEEVADPAASDRGEVASSEDYVDLGSLILGEEEERTTRWKVEAAEPSGDEEADFAEMLGQFKAKVAAHVDMDDIRAHYDLGTAYKDMGLLDEAIAEFQLALRADAHHLPTHEVLGETFLEKGDADVAVRSLERAMSIPRDVEDDLLGIYYYLGRAHEELGNRDSAREFYERAFSLDINFRDVTDRLRQLR